MCNSRNWGLRKEGNKKERERKGREKTNINGCTFSAIGTVHARVRLAFVNVRLTTNARCSKGTNTLKGIEAVDASGVMAAWRRGTVVDVDLALGAR